jgi:hypothetical protein
MTDYFDYVMEEKAKVYIPLPDSVKSKGGNAYVAICKICEKYLCYYTSPRGICKECVIELEGSWSRIEFPND